MITEGEMTKEDMTQAEAKGLRCLECGSLLLLAWGGAYKIDSYILRCGENIEHKGIKERK